MTEIKQGFSGLARWGGMPEVLKTNGKSCALNNRGRQCDQILSDYVVQEKGDGLADRSRAIAIELPLS